MENLQEHWNKAYVARDIKDLGWYEKESKASLDLIRDCNLPKDARILNVGSGTSTITDSLLLEGYENIIVTDISDTALAQLKERLSEYDTVEYIQDDLTDPQTLLDIPIIDLWHDRAVLHFFTAEKDRISYFELLKKLIKVGGYVIFAEFEMEIGANKCAKLDVFRYDEEMLSERLGEDFELVKTFSYTYYNPRDEERPYIYAMYKRL